MNSEKHYVRANHLWSRQNLGIFLPELRMQQHEVYLPEAALAHVARAELDPQISQLRRQALHSQRVVLLLISHVEICISNQ
jgi:hypothetical protein